MAAGDPTGADLCTGTTNGNTLPGPLDTPEEREISLGAGASLVSGKIYAIIVRATSGNSFNSGLLNISTGNGYAGGSCYLSTNSGSTWAAQSSYDAWFVTKSGGVTKDSYNPGTLTNALTFYSTAWEASTFTATSNYTIDSVVLKLNRFGLSGAPGTITVSIRATVGAPSKATTPTPATTATDVTLDQAALTWVDGGGATSYDVYYGTTSGNLTKVSTGQAGLSFTINGITSGSPFGYLITRYWRIDSINDAGTTTGDEWSFTTIRLSPPGVPYWYSTGGYWYLPLVQADGSLGDAPPVGTENIDFEIVSFSANFIRTNRKLVALAKNALYYEAI